MKELGEPPRLFLVLSKTFNLQLAKTLACKQKKNLRNRCKFHGQCQSNICLVSRKSMKCGCEWELKSKLLENGTCSIASVNASHTGGCSPSSDQLVAVKTAAGDYAKCTEPVLLQLVNYLTCGKHPDPQYVQALLRKALPYRKCIHRRDVWNTRV